ncbi:MAG: ROK family transcriptional regulator [Armatimonadetes bacterium]|nr:ROK family transcriptional regulator [Armatimonadota bacterium]
MNSGTRPSGMDVVGVRKINSRAVLWALRTKGRLGRREIAEITNLSFPTVCRVVDELIKDSLIVEVDSVNVGKAKRKTALLDVNPDGGWVAALDVGANHIRAAAMDLRGTPRETVEMPLDNLQGEELVTPAVRSALDALLKKSRKLNGCPRAIGISASGIVDNEQGIIRLSFNLQLRDYPIARIVREICDVPTALYNDVASSTLAEAKLGAGRENSDFAYITVGAGVGAGLVFGGQVRELLPDAEFGLMVVAPEGDPERFGGRGYLESLASGRGIASAARRDLEAGAVSQISDMTSGSPASVTARIVADAAARGDEVAMKVLARAANYLGIGIVNLAHTLGLTMFVVGGGVSRSGDAFWNPLREAVERYEFWPGRITVEPSTLGKDAAVLGAGMLALDKVFAM